MIAAAIACCLRPTGIGYEELPDPLYIALGTKPLFLTFASPILIF
jgi:hypothetical protein